MKVVGAFFMSGALHRHTGLSMGESGIHIVDGLILMQLIIQPIGDELDFMNATMKMHGATA